MTNTAATLLMEYAIQQDLWASHHTDYCGRFMIDSTTHGIETESWPAFIALIANTIADATEQQDERVDDLVDFLSGHIRYDKMGSGIIVY